MPKPMSWLIIFRKVLVNGYLVQVTSLAIHGEYLYWVDRDRQQIERVSKTDGSRHSSVLTRLAHLVDLVAVQFPTEKVINRVLAQE
mgnify:CR=1 FL=1